MKIHVLDHGFVRLVDSMGDDLSIVRAARVSYDADWRGTNASVHADQQNKDEKLIRYLMLNDHTSPFEAVTITFEVKAPIFVFRQWHRHRTWSYNEISARYTELPEEYYLPSPENLGKQSKSNKQVRDMVPSTDEEWITFADVQIDYMKENNDAAFVVYRDLLKAGVPRELARSVLPVSTYSRMFGTVNLHNLFRFLGLRLHEHAQYEIRVYAEAMLEIAEEICPVAVAAFKERINV